jgi:signal transduction histidine kinase
MSAIGPQGRYPYSMTLEEFALRFMAAFGCMESRIKLRERTIVAERTRIARELHDTVASGLAGLHMQIDSAIAEVGDDERARAHLEAAQRLAHWNIAEARRAVLGLRAELLERHDIATALRMSAATITAGLPMHIEITARGEIRRLDPEVENHLLRMGQEAITNALRHARAARMEIIVEFTEQQVTMTVRDDGIGIADSDSDTPGHGLRGMRERASAIGAELVVGSIRGLGSEIVVTVPLENRVMEVAR